MEMSVDFVLSIFCFQVIFFKQAGVGVLPIFKAMPSPLDVVAPKCLIDFTRI